ncbi:MAG: ABC transporter ATP-binding protein [Candidatus Hermodarchaeota archaeon]
MSSGEPEILIEDISWRYTGTDEPVLHNIALSVKKGEIVLVTGPNGAGKTTFCNLLNGLIPHFYTGDLEGAVTVNGVNTKDSFVGYLARHVGLLFQDPASQLISGSVEDEVAFGLENVALPLDEIEKRISFALDYVGLSEYRERPPFALSGGQQQALALACIIAMNPEIYVLDEPTSNLDPYGTRQIFQLLDRISTEEQRTFVIVEHKLEELLDVADRVVVLNEGRIAAMGSPREVLGEKAEFLNELGLWPPQMAVLAYRLRSLGILDDKSNEIPMTLNEGREFFTNLLDRLGVEKSGGSSGSEATEVKMYVPPTDKEPLIRVDDLRFTYPTGAEALKGVSIKVYENEFIAILGQNGSGKTTLVKHFNGLLKPTEGTVVVFGLDTQVTPTYELIEKVGYVFQNPDQQLFSKRVYEEIAFGLKNIGLSEVEVDNRIREVANQMKIEELLEERPYSLSKGDRQRVVISCILALNPNVIVVDEPTTGQDPKRRREIMDLMKELHSQGKTIIVITHDMNLAAEYAERCIVMSDGKILLEGTPKEIFVETDLLATTHLNPPTITHLFLELNKSYDVPCDLLTVQEAVEYFTQVSQRR